VELRVAASGQPAPGTDSLTSGAPAALARRRWISLDSVLSRGRLRLWYLPAAVLVVWAVRYVQFPLGADQGIMLWIADVIRGGGLPYRDTFDVRGPGFYYLHALVLFVFGRNEWGIRVFDLLMLALGGWSVYRIAFRVVGRVGAIASTLLFLLWYAALDYWSSAQSDGWCASILAGVVALLVSREGRLTLWRSAAAGLLVGCCALNKPTYAIFLLLPAVAVLAERKQGIRWLLSRWVAVAAGFALPILVCVAWFAANGALDDLIEVHLRWTVLMYSGIAQPWLTRLQDMIGWLLTSKFAVALGVSLAGLVFLARARRADAALIGLWLALTLFNVVLQGKYWQYHWLVIYPPLAVLTGVGVHALVRLGSARLTATVHADAERDVTLATRSVPVTIIAVLFASALFTPSLEIYRWVKATVGLTNANEYDRMQFGPYGRGPDTFVQIARHIASNSTERDEVLVWGDIQGINYLSARRSPTRFGYVRALMRQRDTRFRPKYLREFFGALQAKPPTYVVAMDERWCNVRVQSGVTSDDHIAFPLLCLSDLPDFQRFVSERYVLERAFGNALLLRLRAPAVASND
jgi:dolichyl-phosphate-mannose-protein mannosyltransferase